jgi:hypothetical protein
MISIRILASELILHARQLKLCRVAVYRSKNMSPVRGS